MDIDNVILKPWQSALIEYMEKSKREVIWVQGAKCEEGKSEGRKISLPYEKCYKFWTKMYG